MFAEFFQENILYFGVFFALIAILIFDIKKNSLGGTPKIFPSKVPLLQRDNSLFIVDVSPKNSFDKGHIAGSVNIPASSFNSDNKLFKPNKEQKILVVCQNGIQAGGVAKKIKLAGFNDVVILDGGIMSWQKDNYPLIKK